MFSLFLIIIFLIILFFSIFLYKPKVSKKKFFITFLSVSFSASLIYFFKGNREAFFFENSVNDEINKLTNDPKSLSALSPQKIIFFLESKLRENPLDLEGWKLLARTCFMTGHTQKAEVHYTKALKYFPFNESLIYEYAVLKKNTDQFQGALKLLKKIGAKIKTYDKTILIKGPKKIKSLKFLETKEYDGFPTDLQAQFMALLCKANGRSVIQERIFENRFTHIGELKRLGAKISIIKNKALIKGNSNFEGAELMSSDLRASVALVIAAIVAKGNSTINRIYHLDRGYENIENKLRKVGVNIKRLS